jgi:hypothetical protein
MRLRLLSEQELRFIFGDPEQYIQPDGSVSKAWELSVLDDFQLMEPLRLSWGGEATRFRCHKLAMPYIYRALHTIHKEGLWKELEPFGGSYNFRVNRNRPSVLSRHAWGLALDVRVDKNPNGVYGGDQHPRVVEIFNENQYLWGGEDPQAPDPDNFDKDPMHFELGLRADQV